MAPKVDPSQLVTIGPLGLAPKVIGDQLAAATQDYKGLRLRCRLDIQNRKATVTPVPSASTLLIQALKEPLRDRKKVKNIKHNGDLALREVIAIAAICRDRSMAVDFVGTLKEMIGTCRAIGCTIDGKSPSDWISTLNESELKSQAEIEKTYC
ncbi:hypothetical protein RCL1_001283 [Eukaryota sp. TZLM3-RCL]